MAETDFSFKISKEKFVDFFLKLVENYRPILISLLFFSLLLLFLSFFVYYNYPLSFRGRLDFSLNNIANNKFPNGTPFNLNDIITNEVLFNVYNKNDLKDYFSSFDSFSDSISITKDNDSLMFLTQQYSNLLSSEDMATSTSRLGLEQEYLRKKEGILNLANYSLLLNYKTYGKKITNELLSKILTNILSEWMKSAIKYKNIEKNNISLLTKNVITPDTLNSFDYLMGIDILRKYLLDVGRDIEKVEAVTNSNSISINSKGTVYSLSDIKLKYTLLKEYQLDPLIGIAEEMLSTHYDPMEKLYIDNKIKNITDELNSLEEKKYMKQSVDQSLNPSQNKDVEAINSKIISMKNEQFFYKNLKDRMKPDSTNTSSANKSIENQVKQEQYKLLQSIYETIDFLQQFNIELGKSNFGSPSDYYTVIYSSSHIDRGINKWTIFVGAIVAWLLYLALTIKLIFLFKYFIPYLKETVRSKGKQ